MLPAEFVVVAILLRLLSGASYIFAVIKGKARPNLISWFFWALTAIIAAVVGLAQGAGSTAFVTLAIGIGPIAVVCIALAKGKHETKFNRTDRWCGALTIAGILLWLATKDPVAALLTSIAVDIISSVPSLVKTWHRPHTEHPVPYSISMGAMAIAMLTVHDWRITSWLFPAYIFGINSCFVFLSATRIGPRLKRRYRRTPEPQVQLAYADKEA